MSTKTQGFTLIELMMVIAIIGILSTIAIPQYQNFIARSQISESIVMMDAARVMIEDHVIETGSFPINQALLISLDVNVIGAYGIITGVTNPIADSGTVVYKTSANNVNKNIQNSSVWFNRETTTGKWSCSSSLPAKYSPKSCLFSSSIPTGI